MELLTRFATTETAEKKDIFSALGIDWQILVFQMIAFLLLVWLLGKYVYPWLMNQVDERQEKIEASVKAAQAAEAKAIAAQEEIAEQLKTARKEASEIVATAKDEAAAMVEASDKKAKSRADKIVEDAHEQIEKDVIAARRTLHNDTIELVALATEKVVSKTMTDKIDDKVIASAVKEAQ
jgi:F-type H+-transporting ATPase subunit b